eukprot:2909006-Alexandrium_andersonii.AAC.1
MILRPDSVADPHRPRSGRGGTDPAALSARALPYKRAQVTYIFLGLPAHRQQLISFARPDQNPASPTNCRCVI